MITAKEATKIAASKRKANAKCIYETNGKVMSYLSDMVERRANKGDSKISVRVISPQYQDCKTIQTGVETTLDIYVDEIIIELKRLGYSVSYIDSFLEIEWRL